MQKARRILRESEETLKDGFGYDNQRDTCVHFERMNGLVNVKEHQLVESSTTWKRDDFDDIINEAIKARDDIPWVVFPRADRHARKLAATGYYVGLLLRNGLKVGFAQEDITLDDESSAMKLLMVFLHGFKAEEDAKQIKRNMLGGRDKLGTERHELPNGMCIWAFDYRAKRLFGKMSTGKPTLNAEKANWVRRWVDWLLEEGIGLLEVCRRMNEADVPPPRGGKAWSSATVRRILRSKQLIGIFEWKGQAIHVEDGERVLTRERFEALQKRLDEIRENSYYNAAQLDYPPLRKMVFHGCGQMMYGVPVNKSAYYRCPKCRKSYINAQQLWEEVQQEIKGGLLQEERILPAIKSRFDNDDVAIAREHDLRLIDERISFLNDKWDSLYRLVSPEYPENRFKKREQEIINAIDKAQKEKAQIERELTILKQKRLDEEGIARFCQLAAKNIDNLTKQQWEILLKLLRLRITVHARDLIKVDVALPPIRDKVRDKEIELSRL